MIPDICYGLWLIISVGLACMHDHGHGCLQIHAHGSTRQRSIYACVNNKCLLSDWHVFI
jgi:hypothetical protein